MGRLTLWGMQQIRPTLLDGVSLPEGMETTTFKTLLNMRMGEQYPYIQVPPILEGLIGSWFLSRQADFQRMYDALSAEYNPIENYDRKEDRWLNIKNSGSDKDTTTLGSQVTTKRTGTETNETTGTETVSTTGKETNTHTGTEGNALQVSAFDSDSYVPRENTIRTPDLTDTRNPELTDTRTPNLTDKRTPDLTDVSTNSGTDTRQTDFGRIEDTKEGLRAHGNIGVTTNQQMVEAEMELRMRYNIYETIMQMFEREFLSLVY